MCARVCVCPFVRVPVFVGRCVGMFNIMYVYLCALVCVRLDVCMCMYGCACVG